VFVRLCVCAFLEFCCCWALEKHTKKAASAINNQNRKKLITYEGI